MKKIVYFLIILTSISCFADVVNRSDAEMRNASKEGRDAALSSPNNSFNTNMSEFSGYQSKPNESNFYKGITSTSTDLNQRGNEAFKNSEIKSVLEDSIKNNPRDDIKWDSEIIQNGLRIKDNADAIVGGSGSQCVKQVVNKSSFENFYCQKDNNVEAVCTNTAKVSFEEVNGGTENVIIPNHLIKGYDYSSSSTFTVDGMKNFELSFSLGRDIKLLGFSIASAITTPYDYCLNPYQRNNCPLRMEDFTQNIRFNIYNVNVIYPFRTGVKSNLIYNQTIMLPQPINIRSGNVIFKGSIIDDPALPYYARVFGKVYAGIALTNNHHINNIRESNLIITLIVESKIYNRKIDWEYNCPVNKENAIKISEYCSQGGGTRNFAFKGINYPVTLDCWQKSEKWLINDISDNECSSLEQKTNCTVGKRECISSLGNTCLRFGITYQCQNIQKQEGYLCGGRFYCDDGSCAGLTRNTNRDFGQAVSQLAALYKAGKDFALNNGSLRAFSGKVLMCRKTGFGFSNCCKDSGWGQSLGIAHCDSEEKELGVAKEKKLAIYVGTFCDKKVLGVCIRKKSSYCAFDNKLARIIQLQGRSGQLHIGFGSAESPDCRGLTVEELQSIKFDNINYSDFFDELDNNKRIPDNNVILDYMKGSIKDKFGK